MSRAQKKAPLAPFLRKPFTGSTLIAAFFIGFLVVRHHPTLLVDLTVSQRVLVAFVRVLAAFELDANRRTDQLQDTTVGVFQVAYIRLRYFLDLVAVDHDQRRVGAAQVSVTQLDAAAADHRWRVLADRIFEDLGQTAGWPAGNSGFERRLYRLVKVTDARTVQCRDEVDVGEVDEEQTALQLDLHVLALARLHTVPFVQRDNQCATRFQGEAQQVQVVIDDTLAGVHHEDHHVGVFDRLQGFDHRELFNFLVDLAALAHTCGVDQRVLLVVTLERDVDTVARGTGLVINDYAVFTEHAINQGRLANVRAADDGNLDTVFFARARNALGFLTFGDDLLDAFFFLGVILREVAQGDFQHLGDTATVSTGDRDRVAQAHRTELGTGRLRIDVIDLVGDQIGTLVALAQVLANHLVGSGVARAGVHQEQHDIGFFDSEQRLLGHLFVHAMLVTGDTTGVDNNVGAPLPLCLTVLAITGQTGQVADDGVASPGQAVEQGGLADVRSAHQGDYGNHAALHFVISENTKAAARQRLVLGAAYLNAACPAEAGPPGFYPKHSSYLMVRASSLPLLPYT